MCWKLDKSCRGVLVLSLRIHFLFILHSFLLPYFLPSRRERRGEERRRVIGFPLIARVMLTVHKSCHWNSASFIFWFCLIVFQRLFPTLVFLPLQLLYVLAPPPCILPSSPASPPFISPRVSSGSLDCLDGPRMGPMRLHINWSTRFGCSQADIGGNKAGRNINSET